MTLAHTRWILPVTVIVLILIFLSSVFLSGIFLSLGLVPPIIHTPYGFVIMNAAIPDTPREMPLYHGYLGPNDTISVEKGSLSTPKDNVTSEQEAPEIVRKALEPYGGLPPDAELAFSATNYYQEVKRSTHEVVVKKATDTTVAYYRKFNGYPLGGQGADYIRVSLGTDGEVLELSKTWRTLEYTGTDATLIMPRQALIRLSTGEVLDPPRCCFSLLFMNSVSAGYHERSNPDATVDLEPVWIISGNLIGGGGGGFIVSAQGNSTRMPS